MFADGVPLSAGQFAPNGTATPDGDGYRLNGRYSFGSGINHAHWAGAGVLTEEPEGADPRFPVRHLSGGEVPRSPETGR